MRLIAFDILRDFSLTVIYCSCRRPGYIIGNSINSVLMTIYLFSGSTEWIPLFLELNVEVSFFGQVSGPSLCPPSWHRATENDLRAYKECLAFRLNDVDVPHDALICVNCNCLNVDCNGHREMIDRYYCDVIDASKNEYP